MTSKDYTNNTVATQPTTYQFSTPNVSPLATLDQLTNGQYPHNETSTNEVSPNETTTPIFPFYDIDELFALPDATYCVNGLITHKSINLIFGDSGSGKTFVTLDLVVGACLGMPFLDRFTVPQPLKVAYMTNEGHGGFKRRLHASMNKFQAKCNYTIHQQVKDNFIFSHTQPQLYDTTSNESIAKFVNEVVASGRVIDILVIDTLSNSIVGGTDSADRDMRIVESGLKYAIERLGCAVVVVHHTNKGDGYRGSTVIRAMADLALKVGKSKDEMIRGYEVTVDKLKDELLHVSPSEGEKWDFVLKGDEMSLSCYPLYDTPNDNQRGNDDITTLERVIDRPMSQRELLNEMCREWNMGKNKVLDRLNHLEKKGVFSTFMGGTTNRTKLYQLAIKDTIQ